MTNSPGFLMILHVLQQIRICYSSSKINENQREYVPTVCNCNRFITVEDIIYLFNNNSKGKNSTFDRLNRNERKFRSIILFFLFPYVRSFLLSRLLHKFLLSLTIFLSQDNGGQTTTTSADYETSRRVERTARAGFKKNLYPLKMKRQKRLPACRLYSYNLTRVSIGKKRLVLN